ncbi:21827_t:CDS:1, partial [Cetraspora pellucida]
YFMLTSPDINEIFNIDEKIQEIDTGLDDDNVNNVLDSILDATDGVGH